MDPDGRVVVIEGNAMMLVRPRNEQFAYKYSVSRIKPPFASMLRRKIDHCEVDRNNVVPRWKLVCE